MRVDSLAASDPGSWVGLADGVGHLKWCRTAADRADIFKGFPRMMSAPLNTNSSTSRASMFPVRFHFIKFIVVLIRYVVIHRCV